MLSVWGVGGVERCTTGNEEMGLESIWVHTKFSKRSLCSMVTYGFAVGFHKATSSNKAVMGAGWGGEKKRILF